MTSKRIEKRFEAMRMIAAVLIGLIFCFCIIIFCANNPFKSLYYLIIQPFKDLSRFCQILEKTTILMMTGCALELMIMAGNFSVIAEGCFLLAPCLTVWAVVVSGKFAYLDNMGELGRIIWIILSLLFSALVGALVGCLPAIIKRIWGCDEVIVSIMLNAIIVQFNDFMVKKILYDAERGESASKPYPEMAKFTRLYESSRLTTGIFIGFACCVITYFIVNHTKLGYQARAVGLNPSFARYSGINVQRTGFVVSALAGALCGMAGTILTLSQDPKWKVLSELGYGNNGIFVGILAKNNPLMLPISSFGLSYLLVGGETMGSNTSEVQKELIDVMTALIIMMLGAEQMFSKAKHKAIVRNAQRIEAAKKEVQE